MFCLFDFLLNFHGIKLMSCRHGQLLLPQFSSADLTEVVNLYSVLILSPVKGQLAKGGGPGNRTCELPMASRDMLPTALSRPATYNMARNGPKGGEELKFTKTCKSVSQRQFM